MLTCCAHHKVDCRYQNGRCKALEELKSHIESSGQKKKGFDENDTEPRYVMLNILFRKYIRFFRFEPIFLE